jgi:hypothetical protein
MLCAGMQTAASPAAVVTWGSNLSSSATTGQAHQQADLFVPLALSGGALATAPSSGQVLSVQVKGIALRSTAMGAPPPMTAIHFQDLRPQPDGSYMIMATSQEFSLPAAGDPNQVSSFTPTNLCVNAGDRLSLTTSGGFDPTFYPMGVDFQIFAPVPGSTTGFYQNGNGTQNGQRITLAPQANVETLMRITEGTGTNATPLCSVTPKTPSGKRHHRKRGRHHGKRRHK